MKRFFCLCGQEVHFHDHYCLACGRDLGYDPQGRFVWSGEIAKDGLFHAHVPGGGQMTYRFCQNREVVSCNWLLSPSEPASQCQCVSCRTSRTIPDQSQPKNPRRWRLLEQAKRQLMHVLLELRLIDAAGGCSIEGLVFDFLEDKRTNPQVELEHVLTGHDNGLITLNAVEADEGFLYAMKEQMQERYRSLLGHFRHEIGHYFWLRLLQTEVSKSAFREVFGDERQDYAEALKHYYRLGKLRFIDEMINLYRIP